MASSRIGLAAALAVAAATLTGCVDDGYGYGGISAGYGAGGYYDEGYAPAYGYGYGGYPAYGWYDGFYYPGTGFYVYDRGGGRRRWDDRQRAYWDARRGGDRAHYGRGPDAPNGGRYAPRDGAGYDREAWRAQQAQRGVVRDAGTPGQVPQAAPPRGAFRGQEQRGAAPGVASPRFPQGGRGEGMAPRGGGERGRGDRRR